MNASDVAISVTNNRGMGVNLFQPTVNTLPVVTYALEYRMTSTAKEIALSTGVSSKPTRGHSDDAGLDLRVCSREPIIVPADGSIVQIPLGVAINLGSLGPLPEGNVYYAELAMRSSTLVSMVNGIGIIDAGYTGELSVRVQNLLYSPISPAGVDVVYNHGDRIAQLVVKTCIVPELIAVSEFTGTATRGDNGFGSTGVT